MNEDDRVTLRQHQVGAPRQVLRVEPVTEAEAVKCLPKEELGLGVATANG